MMSDDECCSIRFNIDLRHGMKKPAITFLFCTLLLGCGGGDGGLTAPADGAVQLLDRAVAASEEGRLGESERLFEDIVLDFSTSPEAADAESLLSEVRVASEGQGLQAVRDIGRAQASFMTLRRRYALTFGELVDALLLERDPSLEDSGYQLRMRTTASAEAYSLTAEPESESVLKRSFFADSTGTIRWALGQTATSDSPELEEASTEPEEN